MVTLTTIQLWSEVAQSIVDWTITLEEGVDEGGNPYKAILLTCTVSDEALRFSPSYSDEELQEYVSEINKQH